MRALAIATAIFLSSTGFANEPATRLLRIDGKPLVAPEIAAFGQQEITLSFDSDAAAAGKMRVDLVVTSGQLAAVVQGNPVNASGEASVSLPDVERVTEMLLVLRLKDGAADRKLGQWRLVVFPRELPKELAGFVRRLAEKQELQLGVFGRAESLRAFLGTHGIAFLDLGVEAPNSLAEGILLLGEIQQPEKAAFVERLPASVRAVLFVADPTLLPGVYARDHVLTVTLPLLSELPTNPRAQHTLLQLIRQAAEPQ